MLHDVCVFVSRRGGRRRVAPDVPEIDSHESSVFQSRARKAYKNNLDMRERMQEYHIT